ncbi:MAG: hypothetical protein WC044_09235 [Crocinitomicaceae bacterium]
MRNYLFILFVFVSTFLSAQEKNVEYFFAGQITNYETGKKEGSVTVTLVSGGRTISTTMSATNGKYTLTANMPAKSNFQVIFSKSGFVSKRVECNFKLMNTDRLKEGERVTPLQDLSLELFTVKPNVDFSFLEKEPVATFGLDKDNIVPTLDIAASQRIKQKIEGLLVNPTPVTENKDANYNAAIKSGDNLFNQKKYEEALHQYEAAAGIKPKEFYPQKKIAEIDALLKAQKDEKAAVSEVDNQYNNLIKAADNFRDNKQYPEAIAKYNSALRVKYEQYPKDEVKKIEDLLAESKKAEREDKSYQEAIAAADVALNAKNYKVAEERYTEALTIKKDEKYPKDQLVIVAAELKKIAEIEATQKKYDATIEAANQLFAQAKYEEAKAKYQEATLVLPKETLPKEKIKACDELIAKNALAAKNEAEVNRLFEEGQKLMDEKSFTAAKGKFTQILTIDPKKATAQAKIDEIDRMIKAEEDKKLADIEANQKKYDATMEAANQLFTQSKFEEAKSKYQEASLILPKETLPKEKIKSCEEQIAKNALASKMENDMNRLFEEGQQLIDQKSYLAAKGKYNEILKIDPKKTLALVKIDDIDRMIKAEADAKNADKIFNGYVAEGDLAIKEERFDDAKMKYGAALQMREDTVLRDKYNALLAKIANKQATQLVDAKFDENMKAAKVLLDAEKYEEARRAYQACANLDDTKPEPKLRLAEIDAKLAKIAESDKLYRSYIDKGDELVKAEKYIAAIQEYNKAILMRSYEKEPKEKADEAERLERAKGDDANAQFEKIIASSKAHIEERDFDKATELLNRAIALRAPERKSDKRPEELLAEIERLKRIDVAYAEKMASAEKIAEEKKFDQAIAKFEEAAKIKPTETLPAKRIEELKKQQSELLGMAERENLFKENYRKGVAAKAAKTYELALTDFKKALTYKTDDQATKDQIAEIQQILDDQRNLQNNDKARREKLTAMIKAADALFDIGDWSEAKMSYLAILDFDKDQAHASSRVAECDLKLRAEMSKAANDEYNELIASADNKFEQKDFQRSKELFTSANEKRPSDPYPKKRLQEIELLMHPLVVQSSALEPLGDVYEGNNAQATLAQADIDRANGKYQGFTEAVNNSVVKTDEEKIAESLENYGTKDAIEKAKSRADQESQLAQEKLSRQNEGLKKIESLQVDYDAQNVAFEQGDNYKSQSIIDGSKIKVAELETIQQKEYASNAEKMVNNVARINSLKDNQSLDYKKDNIESGQELTKMSIAAQNSMNDDNERRATEILIKEGHTSALQSNAVILDEQKTKIQGTADGIRSIVKAEVAKTLEEANRQVVNNNDLNVIESKMLDEARMAYNHEMEIYLVTKDQINNQEKVSVRKAKEANDKTDDNNHKLYELSKRIDYQSDTKSATDDAKNLMSQADLDAIQKSNQISSTESAQQENDNILAIDAKRDAVNAKNLSKSEKENGKNLKTRSDIETLTSENADASTRSIEKQLKNQKMVSEMKTITTNQAESSADRAQENQQALTDKINQVNTAPNVEKSKNTLGEDFPEGVTEEKFSINGSDGKIKTILTRRVVVIDGHGEVYVRTQTNGVSTYKKNDQPINEYTWQKETQNSSLVRH